MNKFYIVKLTFLALPIFFITGCMSTMPKMGGGFGNVISGSAAGSSSDNKNSDLESCDTTLGTLTIYEDQSEICI